MTETETRKIFVIDDDQTDCELIAQTLNYKEFEIITINDLESAIQKAEYIRPDLIFISLSLSWAPVAEAIKSIQSHKGMKRVPFVALTSLPGDFNTLYAGTMGIVDVIEKPINTEELVTKTLNILGEYLISPDKDSLFQGFSAKNGPRETPLQENIFKTEKTDQEPVISKEEPQETFFDKDPVETEKTKYAPVNIKSTASDTVKYKDHEPGNEEEFWGEINYKRKDLIKKRLFIFIVLLISVGIGLRLLFLTDTDEKIKTFSGDISKTEAPYSGGYLKSEGVDTDKTSPDTYPDTYLIETPEDEKSLQDEIFTETIPAEEMEIESKILSPVDNKGTAINSARTKRRVPPKSDFLKPSHVEPKKKETYTEALFPDEMEMGSEFPSAVDDTFEESIAPAKDTDTVRRVKEKKRRVPSKSDFLKKATYSIQIGAYRVENNAISINNNLKKKGYPSFIKKALSDGSPFFKVMVGKYETRDKAEEENRILRQKEGISSFILAY